MIQTGILEHTRKIIALADRQKRLLVTAAGKYAGSM